jgi:hypothetical protein
MARKLSVVVCFVASVWTAGCAEPSKNPDEEQYQAGFVKLFNGEDLTGWEKSGGANWIIKNGLLIGTQGQDYAAGDLLTKQTYTNFIMILTYRVKWPCNSGLWFRYQSPQKTYQVEIIEQKNPECYSGTLYRSGKAFLGPGEAFLAVNDNKKLVNRKGWNTMKVRAQGDHIQVWINGHQVADLHDDASDSGNIGIEVYPGKQFKHMKIVVRELLLKVL